MAGESRWIFSRTQQINTPSRRAGIDSDKELNYRQQTANFIQDMGQKLQVTQLCINTAIVYMHRFYMFHSFSKFNRNSMAAACLFLAAKVEEQPRKLEHVIKVAHMCLHREPRQLDIKSDAYLEQAQELVVNENILLQTLGFDITVDHPHTHVVKTCSLVRASKDLAQTSYFLATNSLHLTSMCLQYRPTIVACVCIHLACKWSNWEIPVSNEGKEWFLYTDKEVGVDLLEELTQDFLTILDKCPSKLKKKILTWKSGRGEGMELGMTITQPLQPPPEPSSHKSSRSSAASSSVDTVDASSSAAPAASTSSSGTEGTSSHPSGQHHAGQPSAASSSIGGMPPLLPPGNKAAKPAETANMRRVKTEPVLNSLTPKEYMERKERERREKEASMNLHQQQQLPHDGHKKAVPHPGKVQNLPGSSAQDKDKDKEKERHHLDIFTAGEEGERTQRPDGQGSSKPDGQPHKVRERPPPGEMHRGVPPGEQHRRSHDAHRHHRSHADPGGHHRGHSGNQRHHQQPPYPNKPHEISNNGHPHHGKPKPPPSTNPNARAEAVSGGTRQAENNPTGAPAVPEHSSLSTPQKDLKIKLSLSKTNAPSPSAEMKSDLKVKIKVPQPPPGVSSRKEEALHRSSPSPAGGDLKLKLDLKGHTRHQQPSVDERLRSAGAGTATPEKNPYVANPGSLKLVISKGKLTNTQSPSEQQQRSSKHHSRHHKEHSKHHSRKRAHTNSPQDTHRISTSHGHGGSHGHPNKMHRTDSSSNWAKMDGLPATNGTHPGQGLSHPNQEQIDKTTQQLAQLINLQTQILHGSHHQNMVPGVAMGDHPPLPPLPPSDAPPPPPPPPPPSGHHGPRYK